MPKICQSCAMPLSRMTRGSHEDNRLHEEYCQYCFKGGSFTKPELTLDEQVDRLAKMAVERKGISHEEAMNEAKTVLPGLKRWL